MTDFSTQKEILTNLEQNLAIYKESIREVAVEILQSGVSRYPIFVASREPIAVGKMIIDKEDLALEWSIYASTLEEFVRRKMVLEEKIDDFRKAWKDPKLFFCIFALLDQTAGFIYVPYD
jgi:hypothetical protein